MDAFYFTCRRAFEGSDELYDNCYKAVARESQKLGYDMPTWQERMVFHAKKRVNKIGGPFYGQGFKVFAIYSVAGGTIDISTIIGSEEEDATRS